MQLKEFVSVSISTIVHHFARNMMKGRFCHQKVRNIVNTKENNEIQNN